MPALHREEVRPVVEPRLAEIVKEELGRPPGRRRLKKERLRKRATAIGALDGIAGATTSSTSACTTALPRVRARALAFPRPGRRRVRHVHARRRLRLCRAPLRFDPATAPQDAQITDAERGHVVLAMLERMNEESDGGVYTIIIETLRTA